MRTETVKTLKLIESGIRSGLHKPALDQLKKRRLIYYGAAKSGVLITADGREWLWNEALMATISAGGKRIA